MAGGSGTPPPRGPRSDPGAGPDREDHDAGRGATPSSSESARVPCNRLGDETSLYLRQHRTNPVAWWPWGQAPFEEARRAQKPVLVSIGYSSCHWCHVMERESFEDPGVAALMNRELVCIKVDREERPDVDQIYMDAVVRLTGQGGWPLNVFCLPDGRPFLGGTYFPPRRAYGRAGWPDVVEAVARLYREQGDRVLQQAEQIMGLLEVRPPPGAEPPPGVEGLRALCERLMERADRRHGGFGSAPKFPMPPTLLALLLAARLGAASPDATAHLQRTLASMARGGIHDHLGGGFHRYSTDAEWLVPHFEKMLYDQGQLLQVYAEAHRLFPVPELAWPVQEGIAYLEREMRGPEGGFYASQDADSDGSEGSFYVWDPAQIARVLGPEEAGAFCEAYGVTPDGTFESSGASVLEQRRAEERPRFDTARARLAEARRARPAPDTDRKHVAAWIGYTISGLAAAAARWQRADWLALAERAAGFVTARLEPAPGELLRVWDEAGARIPAFLDDYAALLGARLDLLRAGGGAQHGAAALVLAERIRDGFFDPEQGDFYLVRAGDPSLVLRPRTESDGATPSAGGLAALGLLRAGVLSGREDLLEVARAALATYAPVLTRTPEALPTLLRASALDEAGLGVAVVVGDPAAPETAALAARARDLLHAEDLVVCLRPGERPDWLAREWLEARGDSDVPVAYVCQGRACSLPATRPQDLALP